MRRKSGVLLLFYKFSDLGFGLWYMDTQCPKRRLTCTAARASGSCMLYTRPNFSALCLIVNIVVACKSWCLLGRLRGKSSALSFAKDASFLFQLNLNSVGVLDIRKFWGTFCWEIETMQSYRTM